MNLRDMLTGMGQQPQQMMAQPPLVDQGQAQFPVAGLPPAPQDQQSSKGSGSGGIGGILQMIMSIL